MDGSDMVNGGSAALPGTSHSNAPTSSLDLTNPDSILSGTNRGTQFVGSSTLQVDSTHNIINISDPTTIGGGVLKLGVVATGGYLGLVVSDGKNDILFAGREADGSIVVKVAKTGFDAKTASGNNLIFNSGQDIFKIVQKGSTTITVPTPSGVGASIIGDLIPHNQTHRPTIIANITSSSTGTGGTGNTPTPWTSFSGTGNLQFIADFNTIDDTNFQFYVQWITSTTQFSGIWTFTYYILQESFN